VLFRSEMGVPARYHVNERGRRPVEEPVRERHLLWARSYAEVGAAALDGSRQDIWLDALDVEHDNFRAALEWGAARPGCEPALALAAALGRFWEVRGHSREGRRWLAEAMRQNPGASPAIRARAANSAGLLALRDRDYVAARPIYEESLALHWDLGDRLGASAVLHAMGNIAFQQRDWEEAQRLFEESLGIGRALGDDRVVAASLTNLGAVAEVMGDHTRARGYYDEALALWRNLGDNYNAAAVLGNLADIAIAQGDLPMARSFATSALEARRAVGDKVGMLSVLRTLVGIAVNQRDSDATTAFRDEYRRLSGDAGPGWLSRLRRRSS
jgi:tetratricopeptide (TPR) repeat protein